ncbi:MAG: metabolite traffic protein EboE [Planctomycetota bacterium]|nr:metabolite traffic protein EboE [Planctomycetota bacterium]
MNRILGYCTNVHPGADLETTRRNLAEHALAVKQLVSPAQPIGVGLWLSAQAADKMRKQDAVGEFAGWLAEVGLIPFTLNGFPFGDFHQPVVKHAVYRPTWCDTARLDYTVGLIEILDRLLPRGLEGSISTVPLEWGSPRPEAGRLHEHAANLRKIVERLEQLEQERGRLIYLCLEPEPGCVLQRSEDVVRFFEDHLLTDGKEGPVRRYLRVCHDVCHSAVMFEDQTEVLRRYQAAGIAVGKVQISSAVVLPWDRIAAVDRVAAFGQFRRFAEDRYLHQTVVRESPDAFPVFWEDLPLALRTVEDPARLTGQWRVHFHVPIYLERFGLIETSRDQIDACLATACELVDLSHFEVETYAWGVLPAELQEPRLADGIAREMHWLRERVPNGAEGCIQAGQAFQPDAERASAWKG